MFLPRNPESQKLIAKVKLQRAISRMKAAAQVGDLDAFALATQLVSNARSDFESLKRADSLRRRIIFV